jgi:hypothetical protein
MCVYLAKPYPSLPPKKHAPTKTDGSGGGGGPTATATSTTPDEEGGQGQQQQQWHPTTVFLTGLLHWGGGEGELRRVGEEGVPGASVKVRECVWMDGWADNKRLIHPHAPA